MTFTQGFGNSTPHHTSTTPLLTLLAAAMLSVVSMDQTKSKVTVTYARPRLALE